jgi:hypothetical protein
VLTVLPTEIVLLASLQTLDLSYNQLISFPVEIGQLVNLLTLKLGGNQLTTLLAEIGQLGSLQNLYLCGSNQLTFVPPEIAQLTNLQELYLSLNYQLTALPAEIGQLVHLRRFSVYGCPIICLPRAVWYRWGQYQGLYTMCRTANVEAYLSRRVLSCMRYVCMMAAIYAPIWSDTDTQGKRMFIACHWSDACGPYASNPHQSHKLLFLCGVFLLWHNLSVALV